MNTYVKIKGHPKWFLEITPETPSDFRLNWAIQERRLKDVGENYMRGDFTGNEILQAEAVRRIKTVHRRFPDYSALARKYNCNAYVRENGTWMTCETDKILERMQANSFPSGIADIVICENSKDPESFWLEYLKNRFPDLSIKTVSYFGTKSLDGIIESFKGAKYVTFSTTFSNFEWYKNALLAAGHRKVIGLCHVESEWVEALRIAAELEADIEVVYKRDINQASVT